MTQGELGRPAPSMPDHFLPPFYLSPELRSARGRLRTALKRLPASAGLCAQMALALLIHPAFFFPGLGAMLVALLVVHLLAPAPEDSDAFTHWSFDEEGFFPSHAGSSQGKVFYREIQHVHSGQGWLQKLSGLGSVEVVWIPGARTSLGSASTHPQRIVKLKLLQEPERLATWLRGRAQAARGEDTGATRVD
jgi:hypothetical protein